MKPWLQQMTAGIRVQLRLQWQILTKVTKRSETGDHRKHSWVRKKSYSFSNLAWKSLANHWVNQSMQWSECELLQGWNQRGGSDTEHHFHLGWSAECGASQPSLPLPLVWCWQTCTQLLGQLIEETEPAGNWENWLNQTCTSAQDSSNIWMHMHGIHPAHLWTPFIAWEMSLCAFMALANLFPHSLACWLSVPSAISVTLSYVIPWNFKIVCWLRFFELLQRVAVMQFQHYFCLASQDRRDKQTLAAHSWVTSWGI